MISRIRANRIGPIKEADVTFGDLTVFVGPQAAGKSIFLQLLKLIEDKPTIHSTMQRFGLSSSGINYQDFFDLYFGEGMASIWSKKRSELILGNSKRLTDLTTYARTNTMCLSTVRGKSGDVLIVSCYLGVYV